MGGCCCSDDYVLKVHIVKATELPDMDMRPGVDPYVKVTYDGKSRKTKYVKNCKEPEFNETLTWDAEKGQNITVEVWDWDRISANDLIGSVRIPTNTWENNDTKLLDLKLTGKKEKGRIQLNVRFMEIKNGTEQSQYEDPDNFPPPKDDDDGKTTNVENEAGDDDQKEALT